MSRRVIVVVDTMRFSLLFDVRKKISYQNDIKTLYCICINFYVL
jgi:hypothetical protein